MKGGGAQGSREPTDRSVLYCRAGIVRDISGVLAKHGANIEELVTDTSSAPMSGEVLSRAHVRLTVPLDADLGHLRAELERFSSELMVELRLVETVTGSLPPRRRTS